MTNPRASIFAAVRSAKSDVFTDPGNIAALDNLLDAFGIAREAETGNREVGPKGIALLHRWEGCKLKAYPDPGSSDGKPWTIGWGSTGPDITSGTVWTQAQADARFEKDVQRYADEVSKAIGNAPTSQEQFDALVAFHYNTGKIASATLTKKHVAGDYEGAIREFGKWVYNDGNVMKGLQNRRADEAALYRSGS